jgi:HD-like signal output (HDOD) protein
MSGGGESIENERKSMKEWLAFFLQADIPVLTQTACELQRLHENEAQMDPSHIARVVAEDPLMTVKLLRFLQTHKHASQRYELINITQILLMIGVETFYREVPASPVVEDILHDHHEALEPLQKTIRRARRAAYYAYDWALSLHQSHPEEAQIAALLTHVTELLMWCFNPGPMLEIRRQMEADKNLRSAYVQNHVLGFSGRDIQRQLVADWHLPALLANLMDPAQVKADRVRHVMLAVNLARHAENGWRDAALSHDYREIAALLHVEPRKIMDMVHGKPIPEKW